METKKSKKQLKEIIFKDKEFITAQDKLEQTIMQLVFDQQFYANLILNMSRNITTEVPTAAVNVTDRVNLWINPYFFNQLSLLERVDLLLHEAHHVLHNHFVRFKDLEPKIYEKPEGTVVEKFKKRFEDMTNASILNQAGDYAINEYLPNLPKKVNMFNPDGSMVIVPLTIKDEQGNEVPNPDPEAGKPLVAELCFVETAKKKMPGMEHKQTTEYYYEFLKKEQQKNGGQQQVQFMVLDDHSVWHDTEASADQITEKVKEVVNKALEQTSEHNVGRLPGDVKAAIDKLNYVPKDWRGDIQRFAAKCSEKIMKPSRKRRNRRYGFTHPGFKILRPLQLAVHIDSSGSVDDECLNQFHAEIGRLHSMGVIITVIECDATIQQIYKFDPKKKFNVKGRGGTAIKPVFDELKNKKWEIDGLISFTDGGFFKGDTDAVTKPKFPVLWALTPPYYTSDLPKWFDNGTKSSPFTKIEVKKKVRT